MRVWDDRASAAEEGVARSGTMDLESREVDLLEAYLAPFLELAGDRRTARLLAGTVRGIVGSESLVCAKIAAFSPCAGRLPVERAPDPPHAAR
jgi:hypothetical protein